MAIEDIIQIKDTVSKDGIIPLDRNQDVMNAQNQVDFLRTQKEMGLSENAVMAKLIQMFVEEPTRFTQEFGKESAEAIREFLGFETQGDMEKKGYVFDDNSSEIIGQKIDYEVANPEDSAIGTITTEQSEKIRVLTPEQIEAMGLPQGNYSQNMTTGEIKLIDEQTDDVMIDDIEITDDMIEGDTPAERVKEFVEKITGVFGKGDGLSEEESKTRRLTLEEIQDRGLPYTDGQIYILDIETGEITRKEPKGIEKIILDVMDWFKYGRTDPENRDYK